MKPTTFNQHTENTEANNKLSFYKDEVRIMQGRLDEIASKNNKKDIQKEIEHFQNQIIIQSKNIEDLRKDILSEENWIRANVSRNFHL
jgi:hypothetical protein